MAESFSKGAFLRQLAPGFSVVALGLLFVFPFVLLTACKKAPPTPAPVPSPAVAEKKGAESPAPPSAVPEESVRVEEDPAAQEAVAEPVKAPEPQLAEANENVERGCSEDVGCIGDAANTTRELGGVLSQMLREMKPHESDTEKLIEIQQRYRPAIDDAFKRGEALVNKLTEGEKVLLQQHGIAMLQELSEYFVGLPAEVVVPVADELLRLVGVETEHQFD